MEPQISNPRRKTKMRIISYNDTVVAGDVTKPFTGAAPEAAENGELVFEVSSGEFLYLSLADIAVIANRVAAATETTSKVG
jgi:hypothetical protein